MRPRGRVAAAARPEPPDQDLIQISVAPRAAAQDARHLSPERRHAV